MPSSVPHHPSAQRVDRALTAFGLIDRVRELPDSTRTATDAARALQCEVRQIVKSLVFRVEGSETPVLALVAGDHKLDERWMEGITGHGWVRADPEFARAATGFAIGGVPPLGHLKPLRTFVDYDLLEQREIWAAAGHPNAVCRLSPSELLRITGGTAVPVVPIVPRVSMPGSWITFDCCATLIDGRRGLEGSLARAVALEPGVGTGSILRTYLEEERRREEGPYAPYRAIMTDALVSAAARLGIPADATRLRQFPDSVADWPAFPDARASLESLRESGYRLAVLSNLDRDLLSRTLDRHSLAVDLALSAGDTHAYKPLLALWIRFLKETGAVPGAACHVAGRFESDISPARLLGFRTIFVSRYEGPPEAAQVDVVPDLAELPTHFQRTSGQVTFDR